MKKLFILFGVILFTLFILSGCSSKAKDIKISELSTVCNYVNAMKTVVNEMLPIKDSLDAIRKRHNGGCGTDQEKLKLLEESKDYILQIEELEAKLQEIKKAAEDKSAGKEFEECPSYKTFKEIQDVLYNSRK